jgi:hypothetical protein
VCVVITAVSLVTTVQDERDAVPAGVGADTADPPSRSAVGTVASVPPAAPSPLQPTTRAPQAMHHEATPDPSAADRPMFPASFLKARDRIDAQLRELIPAAATTAATAPRSAHTGTTTTPAAVIPPSAFAALEHALAAVEGTTGVIIEPLRCAYTHTR